jgi:outer membrane protein TolC
MKRTLLAALFACCLGPAAAELPQPLTLEHALSLADLEHPSLQAADARVAQARSELERVDALDNWRVDLELAGRYIEPSSTGSRIDPSNNDSWAKLRVHRQLYDFGRSDGLNEAAEAELRERQFMLVDVRQRRRIAIMSRFFDVLLADLEQARDNESMAIAYVRMDRARSRHDLGQVSDLELLKLEAAYRKLLTRQRVSQSKQRTTRSRLALALAHPDQLPGDLVTPQLADLQRPPGEVQPLVEQALSDNPELRALRKAVSAAQKRVEAAGAGNGATLRGELQGAAYNRVLGSSDPFSAALVLDVPLYTGGSVEAEQARQRALMREKQAQLSLRELEVRQSVLDLWLQIQTLHTQRQEMATLGEYRELDFDRSRTLYELEAASDLGDAMTMISEHRLLQAQTDFQLALSWARLDALVGRLIGGADGPAAEGVTP